jgi:hypothetical protein
LSTVTNIFIFMILDDFCLAWNGFHSQRGHGACKQSLSPTVDPIPGIQPADSHFTVEAILARYANGKYVPAWNSGTWTATGLHFSFKNYNAVAFYARMRFWRSRIIHGTHKRIV